MDNKKTERKIIRNKITDCNEIVDCLKDKFPEINRSIPGACEVLVGMCLKIKNHSNVVHDTMTMSVIRKLTELEYNNGVNNFNDLIDELKNLICLSSVIYNSSIELRRDVIG